MKVIGDFLPLDDIAQCSEVPNPRLVQTSWFHNGLINYQVCAWVEWNGDRAVSGMEWRQGS